MPSSEPIGGFLTPRRQDVAYRWVQSCAAWSGGPMSPMYHRQRMDRSVIVMGHATAFRPVLDTGGG